MLWRQASDLLSLQQKTDKRSFRLSHLFGPTGDKNVNADVSQGLQTVNEISYSQQGTLPSDGVDCWVAFGGNLGEVRANFDAALALLSLHPHIELGKRSGLYCTAPMGSQAGSRYLNSVCGLRTRLPAQELLTVLQSVETQLGRVRSIDWGPRTLDLDLLSYGDLIIEEPRLVIPHPSVTYRRFVLDPLVEVAPDWRHPTFEECAEQMLSRLKNRPLRCCLGGLTESQQCSACGELATKFPDIEFVFGEQSGGNVLPIHVTSPLPAKTKVVDLRRSPGDFLEQLSAAFTAILDVPTRVSDW